MWPPPLSFQPNSCACVSCEFVMWLAWCWWCRPRWWTEGKILCSDWLPRFLGWGFPSGISKFQKKKKILSHRAFLEELLVTVCMGRTRLQVAALSWKKLAGKTGKKPQKVTWLSHLLLHSQSPARNCPRTVLKNLWNEHQRPKSFCLSGYQPQTRIWQEVKAQILGAPSLLLL